MIDGSRPCSLLPSSSSSTAATVSPKADSATSPWPSSSSPPPPSSLSRCASDRLRPPSSSGSSPASPPPSNPPRCPSPWPTSPSRSTPSGSPAPPTNKEERRTHNASYAHPPAPMVAQRDRRLVVPRINPRQLSHLRPPPNPLFTRRQPKAARRPLTAH